MTRMLSTLAAGLLALFVLVACAPGAAEQDPPAHRTDALRVVTSFTLLEDMVRAIGGDLVEVHNLVPTGTDPHEYEPLPADLAATVNADLLVLNGLGLEGGDTGWAMRLVAAAELSADRVIEVAHDVTPLYVGRSEGEAQINPHAFVAPGVGVQMAEAIRDGLRQADPVNAARYEGQAETYIAELEAIEAEYDSQLGEIPAASRVLVTSERAFQYLANEYAIEELYLWEIDTEESGSAQQLMRLIDQLREQPAPHLIVESNVDRRPLEMVSEETGIPIFERVIYSDEIGGEGSPGANSYLEYLEYNLRVLVEALK